MAIAGGDAAKTAQLTQHVLGLALEVGKIGAFDIDLVGGCSSRSPEIDKLWGIEAGFAGDFTQYCWDHIHPDDFKAVRDFYSGFFVQNEEQETEFRIVRPDGAIRWLRWRGRLIRNAAGAAVCVVGVNLDITEQKATEGKIKRLSMLYAALSETSQAIVHSKSADELLERVCRIVVEQGKMKLAWIGVADEDGKVRVQTAYGPGIDCLSGIEVSLDAGDPLGCGPAGTAIREGKPSWCDSFLTDPVTAPWHERAAPFGWKSTAAIPLHLRGKTIGALAIYDDMFEVFDDEVRRLFVEIEKTIGFALDHFANEDERKRGEAELQILRKAVEQSASTIVITDPMGNIEYVNPAFEKSTGYSTAEAIGQNPRILKSGEQDAEFYLNLWRTITSGNVWRGEFPNRRKDGSLYWEVATISPVQNEMGGIVHFIAIKEDITERKALEGRLNDALHRAEEGSRTKSEFLAIMSHELRTPLNGVLGFAELLFDTDLNEEQKSFAKTIAKSGNRLLTIVNNILDFSSIEKSSLAIHCEPIDVAELVKTSEQAVLKSAMEKGIPLQSAVESSIPKQILGDDQRIRQILINLLGNAVKFTSSGSVTLRVATVTEGGRPFLDFSVEDTGIGISPETIKILFMPFTQAEMNMTRTFGGTGLGLAISQRLAEAMGGKITVVSTVGKGSTFTFRLPIKNSASCERDVISPSLGTRGTPGAAQEGVLPDTGGAPPNRPVLVVEDDKTNSALTGKMLQSLGYQEVANETGGHEFRIHKQIAGTK